jgi:two-component system repressor protein LuxO
MSVIVKSSEPAACVAAQVLLVSSRPDVSHLYSEVISQGGFGVTVKATCEDAIVWLRQEAAPLAVLDLSLAGMHGLELLRVAQAENFKTAIIAISRDSSLKLAIEAMKLGALDYLVEPFDTERLLSTLRQASPLSPALDSVTEQDETPRAVFQGFVGKSPAMREIYSIIEKAAASSAKVFITGESGTGKEVCAHAIHSCSPRRNKPFVAVNCAAIPRELMESEIFGHVKGAFTGAIANRTGAATEALGGTLFLDEICELSLDLQAKLLRLVNDGTFQCLGSSKVEQADIRLVCATNRDPRVEVKEGRFREDLFYRLHVIPIHLPPLRERGNDIMQIATYLLHDLSSQEGKHFRGFTPEAEALMRGHPWPGNVRELQNALYNAIALNNGVVVDEAMLPPSVGDDTSRAGSARATERADAAETAEQKAPAKTVKDIKPLWLVEREAITEALEICGQNIPKAAAILEISVSTIYRKKLEYEALERSKAG